MTVTVANTANTNTVQYMRTRLNELAYAMSVQAVTTNSNAATGNAVVNGTFTSNNLYVSNVYGGVVGAPSNLTFFTNVVYSGARTNLGLAANVSITAGNATHRVLVVNTTNYTLLATQLTMADHSDANVTAVANSQVLVYFTSEGRWKNQNQTILSVGNSANLNGQPATYYTNASNMSTGTLPSGRLTGSYTGITAVGTLTSVDIGAADTTIARAGVGDISIEGNIVYRAGGTDVAVADGGTGASDAATARTNLGLGTIATQAASAVSITGGSITGITDLAVADGGTGASTAAGARANLGVVSATDIAEGLIELATNAEVQTGTDAVRAVTPAGLTAKEATAAQFRSNTADRILTTNEVWASANTVTLTDAATVAVDFSTGFNFTVTLAGNRALGNPTNQKVGQAGFIRIVQDATGSRTLSYSSSWKFAGGVAPVLTTTANATDVLYYQVLATDFIHANLIKDVK